MTDEKETHTFVLEGWVGEGMTGYYYRSDLFQAIEKFKANGKKIVGIRITEDDWTIEFICEDI